MVDNNAETLRFLQENMGAIIHNVKMLKQLEALDSIKLTKECRKYDGIPQELAKQIFACGSNKDHMTTPVGYGFLVFLRRYYAYGSN